MVQGHALGQPDNSKFGGAVGESIANADYAPDRCQIDNDALFARYHLRQKSVGHVENAAHIYRTEPIQILPSRLEHRSDVPDAGVVDEDVQSPMLLMDPLGSASAIVLTRYVQPD